MIRELKLPKTYTEMSLEEMMLIEGGYRTTRSVYVPAGTKTMTTAQYIDTTNTQNNLASLVVTSVVGLQVSLLWGTAFGIAAGILSVPYNTASKAEALDIADGTNDDRLTVWWSGRWVTETNPYPPNSYEGAMF